MLEHGDVYKIEERSVFYCKFFLRHHAIQHTKKHTLWMNHTISWSMLHKHNYADFRVSHTETLPAVYMTRTI